MRIISQKIGWAARVLTSAEVWRIVFNEVGRGWAEGEPAISSLEEDRAANLTRVEIGGHAYWLPSSMNLNMLGKLHSEVFCESHPHYYQHGECSVRSGDVVLDAGASEGFFTRFALERGARVIAVEPWEPMAKALSRTFETEISEGRVEVVRSSLGVTIGRSVLQCDPARPWSARIVLGETSIPCDVVAETTIDALVGASRWRRCDFLKMDIEGSEQDALRGAIHTLRRDRPRVSIAVYHHATGYLDISRTLRLLRLDYTITGKGLQMHKGIPRPMMLHAWPV